MVVHALVVKSCMEINKLHEYRCACSRLLFKGVVERGHIEIKCRRCSDIVIFDSVTAITEKVGMKIQDAPGATYTPGAS